MIKIQNLSWVSGLTWDTASAAFPLPSKLSKSRMVVCAAVLVRRSREKNAGLVRGEAGPSTHRGGEAAGAGDKSATAARL